MIEASGEIPAVNQIEWSPFGHSLKMGDLTRTKRLGDEVLARIARGCGKSTAQILIRWSLRFGTVPIPKANQKRHLEECLDVFDFDLDEDDMSRLSGLNEYYSCLGFLPYV